MKFPPVGNNKEYTVTYPLPIGGLNASTTPRSIQDNQLADCNNLWLDEGHVRTRPGMKLTSNVNTFGDELVNLNTQIKYTINDANGDEFWLYYSQSRKLCGINNPKGLDGENQSNVVTITQHWGDITFNTIRLYNFFIYTKGQLRKVVDGVTVTTTRAEGYCDALSFTDTTGNNEKLFFYIDIDVVTNNGVFISATPAVYYYRIADIPADKKAYTPVVVISGGGSEAEPFEDFNLLSQGAEVDLDENSIVVPDDVTPTENQMSGTGLDVFPYDVDNSVWDNIYPDGTMKYNRDAELLLRGYPEYISPTISQSDKFTKHEAVNGSNSEDFATKWYKPTRGLYLTIPIPNLGLSYVPKILEINGTFNMNDIPRYDNYVGGRLPKSQIQPNDWGGGKSNGHYTALNVDYDITGTNSALDMRIIDFYYEPSAIRNIYMTDNSSIASYCPTEIGEPGSETADENGCEAYYIRSVIGYSDGSAISGGRPNEVSIYRNPKVPTSKYTFVSNIPVPTGGSYGASSTTERTVFGEVKGRSMGAFSALSFEFGEPTNRWGIPNFNDGAAHTASIKVKGKITSTGEWVELNPTLGYYSFPIPYAEIVTESSQKVIKIYLPQFGASGVPAFRSRTLSLQEKDGDPVQVSGTIIPGGSYEYYYTPVTKNSPFSISYMVPAHSSYRFFSYSNPTVADLLYEGDETNTLYRMNLVALNGIHTWFGGTNAGYDGGTRLFVAGHPEFKNVLRWSGVNDPTYFQENNFAYIGRDDEAITALAKQDGYLVVFKENEMYALEYEQTMSEDDKTLVYFPIKPISPYIGCDCPDTVQLINNRLTWLHSDGKVYTLFSESTWNERNVKELSQHITPLLKSHKKEDLQKAKSLDFEEKYFIFVTDSSTLPQTVNDKTTVYLWDYDQVPLYNYTSSRLVQKPLVWWKWSFDGTVVAAYEYENEMFLLLADNGTPYSVNYKLVKLDRSSETDVIPGANNLQRDIETSMKSKLNDYERPMVFKRIRTANFETIIKPMDTLEIKFYTENDAEQDAIEKQNISTDEEYAFKVRPNIHKARMVGYEINSNKPIEIITAQITAEIYGSVK